MPTPMALTPLPGRSACGITVPSGLTIETCPALLAAQATATVPSGPTAVSVPTLPPAAVATVIGAEKTLAALPRTSSACGPEPATTSDRPPATNASGAELPIG